MASPNMHSPSFPLPLSREREASRGADGAHVVRFEFDMYYSV